MSPDDLIFLSNAPSLPISITAGSDVDDGVTGVALCCLPGRIPNDTDPDCCVAVVLVMEGEVKAIVNGTKFMVIAIVTTNKGKKCFEIMVAVSGCTNQCLLKNRTIVVCVEDGVNCVIIANNDSGVILGPCPSLSLRFVLLVSDAAYVGTSLFGSAKF